MGSAMSTPGVFITGTNTGVGKTVVSTALLRLLRDDGIRAIGLKPVATGGRRAVAGGPLRNDDALALQAASADAPPYEWVNPFCFEPAIAPHIAAAEADVNLDLEELVGWYGRVTRGVDLAVVEGAGGWRVPLHPTGYLSDLPERLGLGVILVVGLTLGCLNHARLTFEAIERSGRCRLLGWIANGIDARFERREQNVDALAQLLGSPPLAAIPPLTGERIDADVLHARLLAALTLRQTLNELVRPRSRA
jgi:dethiobiotin synthetase